MGTLADRDGADRRGAGGLRPRALRVRASGPAVAAALIPQMLPVIVVVIPIYMIFRSVGLLDNVFSLAFTYLALTVPISVWILYNFVRRPARRARRGGTRGRSELASRSWFA